MRWSAISGSSVSSSDQLVITPWRLRPPFSFPHQLWQAILMAMRRASSWASSPAAALPGRRYLGTENFPDSEVGALETWVFASVFCGAFCLATHAATVWQPREHHLASLRLGINSAPQLRQISMRLAAGFRRNLRNMIRPRSICVEIPIRQHQSAGSRTASIRRRVSRPIDQRPAGNPGHR